MPARTGINLLPRSEFDASLWGRTLRWALTSGRYILIITELVVVMAFLSRFKLDKDMSDLANAITGKKAILEALKDTEDKFIQTQDKLAFVKQVLDTQVSYRQILDSLLTHVPPSMTITSLSLVEQRLILSAQAGSQQTLGEFLQRLETSRQWQELELTDITATPEKGLTFTIQSIYKK